MKQILIFLLAMLSIVYPLNAMNSKDTAPRDLITVSARLAHANTNTVIFQKNTEYEMYPAGFKLNGWDSMRDESYFIDTEITKLNQNIISIEYRVRRGDLTESIALTRNTLQFPMLYNQRIDIVQTININGVLYKVIIGVLKKHELFH
jgi:hypothetical protein